MGWSNKFLGVALLLASASQPAQAAGPATQQWVLDQSGYYCALATKVAGPPDATLVLRTLPGTWTYDLMLVGQGWPASVSGARKQIAFALQPSAAAESREPGSALVGGAKMIALRGLGGKLIDAFPGSSALEVRADGKPALSYALPANAADALQALDKCIASKLIEAGADPAGFEPGARAPSPIGDSSKWLDVPPILTMGDGEGVHAAILLDLNPAGKPTDCVVLELQGNVGRERACQNLLQRARYEPARDPKGNGIRSIVVYDLDELVRVTFTVEGVSG